MHITFVKKRLANGEPCEKCKQASELIEQRGFSDAISEIVWAEEGNADSPGIQLGVKHGVEVAPFFILRDEDGNETVVTSVLRLLSQLKKSQSEPVAASADAFDLEAAKQELAGKSAETIMAYALKHFGADCGIAFSGAEDIVLVDLAVKTGRPFRVFCLDTGRLHPETYRFIDRVRKHYGIEIHVASPDCMKLQAFVREKGLFSFYDDGHKECCGVRKIEPLRRSLKELNAWISGQRHDQSPATRSDVAPVEEDGAFEGRDGRLIKFNPIAKWTSAQVWSYIRAHDVPYNELHDNGYVSIGCEPCTRALRPGEHERAARWWWEDSTKRECGLHVKED